MSKFESVQCDRCKTVAATLAAKTGWLTVTVTDTQGNVYGDINDVCSSCAKDLLQWFEDTPVKVGSM